MITCDAWPTDMRALRDVSYLVAECLICLATGLEIVFINRPASLASLNSSVICRGEDVNLRDLCTHATRRRVIIREKRRKLTAMLLVPSYLWSVHYSALPAVSVIIVPSLLSMQAAELCCKFVGAAGRARAGSGGSCVR